MRGGYCHLQKQLIVPDFHICNNQIIRIVLLCNWSFYFIGDIKIFIYKNCSNSELHLQDTALRKIYYYKLLQTVGVKLYCTYVVK